MMMPLAVQPPCRQQALAQYLQPTQDQAPTWQANPGDPDQVLLWRLDPQRGWVQIGGWLYSSGTFRHRYGPGSWSDPGPLPANYPAPPPKPAPGAKADFLPIPSGTVATVQATSSTGTAYPVPVGPQGPPGPPGATGPAGPAGPRGPPGKDFSMDQIPTWFLALFAFVAVLAVWPLLTWAWEQLAGLWAWLRARMPAVQIRIPEEADPRTLGGLEASNKLQQEQNALLKEILGRLTPPPPKP